MPCDEGRWRLYRCGGPSGIEVRRGGWCSLAGRPDDPKFDLEVEIGGVGWMISSYFNPFAWDISGLQEVPLC